MEFWQLIGIGLLIWWLWDLFTGVTYIVWSPISRTLQPLTYSFTMLIWGLIAISLAIGFWK